jgi:hypothetical protein
MNAEKHTRYFDLPVGVAIKCVEQDENGYGCVGCDFNVGGGMISRKCNVPEGLICGHYREDEKGIIFKLVKYQEKTVKVKTVNEVSWEAKDERH